MFMISIHSNLSSKLHWYLVFPSILLFIKLLLTLSVFVLFLHHTLHSINTISQCNMFSSILYRSHYALTENKSKFLPWKMWIYLQSFRSHKDHLSLWHDVYHCRSQTLHRSMCEVYDLDSHILVKYNGHVFTIYIIIAIKNGTEMIIMCEPWGKSFK